MTDDRYDWRRSRSGGCPSGTSWRRSGPAAGPDAGAKKYVLDMFPYPSGDLHMGHAEAYALGDVVARYWVQRGFNVHAPDRLGRLRPAGGERRHQARRRPERRGRTRTSRRRRRRCAGTRCSFDWDRVLNTCDPEYYRWNQWLFLRLFERGLAYRKDSAVNWCPNDQTVLANEQVVGGLCERCDTPVTKKKLTQWYFRITDYADRLLDDMAQLEGAWPEQGAAHAAQLDRPLHRRRGRSS